MARLHLPFQPMRRVEVFATDVDSVQVTWRDAPPGEVVVEAGGSARAVETAGGPGATEVRGFEPGAPVELTVGFAGREWRLRTRTLPAPPGRRLAKIATISDLHLGEKGFGLVVRRPERPTPHERHPLRCSRAAVREAVAWGAELLVVKGDLTHAGRPEEWLELDRLLADIPIPVILMPGNHDAAPGSVDFRAELERRGHPHQPVRVHDHRGVRVITVDTLIPGRGFGRLRPEVIEEAASHAARWDGPVLVCCHHHLDRLPLPWFWPLGVRKPAADRLLSALAAATSRALVTSGHTHRHRRHHRAVPVAEVGSPKDYPGVWAGYDVYEGGIVQVVRRVADLDCITWTDGCRRAVGGWWGRWSPGTLDQRCFTLVFDDAPSRGAAGRAEPMAAQPVARTS